jgi:ElaB/YqjD/DUF883 family membrane-anchored ribosome-binding protein
MTTSEQLERQAESTRNNIIEALDELRERMTPGQIMDQTLDFTRDGRAGQFVRNLGQQVVDNPLPAVMIAAGVGWLMMGSRHPRHNGGYPGALSDTSEAYSDAAQRAARASASVSDRTANAAAEMADDASDFANDMAQRGGETAEQWADRIRGALNDLAQRAGETTEEWAARTRGMASGMSQRAGETTEQWAARARGMIDDMQQRTGETAEQWAERTRGAAAGLMARARALRESLRDAAGSASEAASSAYGSAAHLASGAYDATAGGARRAAGAIGRSASAAGSVAASGANGLAQFLKEQPLVLAGIGLALGAAIGAMLPESETENRIMGETSDSMKERAAETAEEKWQEGKEAVQHVADAAVRQAKHEAAEQGLMSEDGGDQPSLIPEVAGQGGPHEVKPSKQN